MKVIIPKYLAGIIETFIKTHHQIYLVGGCLRDLIIGNIPHDFDLATSALPDEVSALFPKTINVGKQFGTIIIPAKNHNIEVTTLRKENNYIDSRHPEQVIFCSDILQDLSRRDFTMNAIAYDLKNKHIIDPYKGKEAIKNKTIKCVGDPILRLQEDTLRIFRAARFASQLNFSIENTVELAIKQLSTELKLPAAERIRIELIKLLQGHNYIAGLAYLNNWELLDRIFITPPGFFTGRIKTIPANYDIYQKLAYIITIINKTNQESTLKNLRFTRKETRLILDLINNNYDYNLVSLTIRNLALSGGELKEAGYTGINIGKIQRILLGKIKTGQLKNTKKELINAARQCVGSPSQV